MLAGNIEHSIEKETSNACIPSPDDNSNDPTKLSTCNVASGYFPSWLYPEDTNIQKKKSNIAESRILNPEPKKFRQSVYRLLNLNECWVDDNKHIRPLGGGFRHLDDTSSIQSDSNIAYMKLTARPAQRTSSSGVGLSEREQNHVPSATTKSAKQISEEPIESIEHNNEPSYLKGQSSDKPNIGHIQSVDIDGEQHRTDRANSRASRCIIN